MEEKLEGMEEMEEEEEEEEEEEANAKKKTVIVRQSKEVTEGMVLRSRKVRVYDIQQQIKGVD